MINITEEMKIGLTAIAEVLQVMLVMPVMEADGWLTVLRSSYSSCRCENGRMVREGGGNYCWCFGKQHDVLSVAPRVQPTPPSCIPRTWLLKNCRFVGSQRAWPQGSLSLYYKRQTVKAGNQTTHFLLTRVWLASMRATKHAPCLVFPAKKAGNQTGPRLLRPKQARGYGPTRSSMQCRQKLL